jgi:alkylation response protein AidB-like acyl-CoA dehydrogenase
MFDFIAPTDPLDLRTASESIRRFAVDYLASKPGSEPHFSRLDFEQMAKLGLTAAGLPEVAGGDDMPPLGLASIIFELSRVQLGPAIYLSVHLMVARLIAKWDKVGNHSTVLKQLAQGDKLGAFCLTEAGAGSDAAALKTTAVETADGYRLDGEKIYITSAGHADVYLIFARTAGEATDGISAFVVDKSVRGISFGPHEKKMGCSGSPIASVKLSQCEVPKSALLGELGQGYKIALSGLAGGRVNIAAAACGLAASALEHSTRYAADRKQFNRAICDFQGIQFMLADMAIKLQAAILVTRDGASKVSDPQTSALAASIAKCFATDRAMEITIDAVQIFGGAGYLADFPVERLMRDAKMLQIVEGTNQIQRMVIGREILKKI